MLRHICATTQRKYIAKLIKATLRNEGESVQRKSGVNVTLKPSITNKTPFVVSMHQTHKVIPVLSSHIINKKFHVLEQLYLSLTYKL
jgi:hypothetical protein